MRFELDPERSTVTVHASSSVHPITTGAAATGWLELPLDADGRVPSGAPVGGEIEVALGSMRSGNPLVDREAERRLHLRRFPTVTGRLDALSPAGPPAATDDKYDGEGTLDFHGTSRPLHGTLRLVPGDGSLAVTGRAELDVTDFGVQPPSLLVVKVHARVRVELVAVAVPVDP